MARLAHDSEEHAAFVPSCLNCTTKSGGERGDGGVLELIEAFRLHEYLASHVYMLTALAYGVA